MNYKPFAHKLFGGKNRAEILMAICASPEPVPENTLPVASSYNRKEALKAFERAGIIVRVADGRLALDEAFRGARDLRRLGSILSGLPEPATPLCSGQRGLLQPTLFGRPACTRVLAALATSGPTTFDELRCGLSSGKLRRVLTRLRRIGVIACNDRISFGPELLAREPLIATASACQSEGVSHNEMRSSRPFAALFGGPHALTVFREMVQRGEMTSAEISSIVPGQDYRMPARTLMARGLIVKVRSRYLARFALGDRVVRSSVLRLICVQSSTSERPHRDMRVFSAGWTPILKAIATGSVTARDVSQRTSMPFKTVCAQVGLLKRNNVLQRGGSLRFADFPEAPAVIAFLRDLPA